MRYAAAWTLMRLMRVLIRLRLTSHDLYKTALRICPDYLDRRRKQVESRRAK